MTPIYDSKRIREGIDLAHRRGFKILGHFYSLTSPEWFDQSLLAADYLDDHGYSDVAEFVRFYQRGWYIRYQSFCLAEFTSHFEACASNLMDGYRKIADELQKTVCDNFINFLNLPDSLIGTPRLTQSISKPAVSATVRYRWGLGRLSPLPTCERGTKYKGPETGRTKKR